MMNQSPTMTVSAIREQLQRRHDERAQLVEAHRGDALAAVEGCGDAVARRISAADRIAEVDLEIRALSDAVPFAEARERAWRVRERDALVVRGREQLAEITRAIDTEQGTLANSLTPTPQDFADLRMRGRQRDDLRAALFRVTGAPEFATTAGPSGVVDEVASIYRQQHETREQAISRSNLPGSPRPTLPANEVVDRLRALTEALTQEKT